MMKSIETKLTGKQVRGLKNNIELSRKAALNIVQSFYKNHLSEEKERNELSYPIPITKEKRAQLGQLLFHDCATLIANRNDPNQEEIPKAVAMLNSEEDFPEYELVIQFRRPSKEKEFFLKRVYVRKKADE